MPRGHHADDGASWYALVNDYPAAPLSRPRNRGRAGCGGYSFSECEPLGAPGGFTRPMTTGSLLMR